MAFPVDLFEKFPASHFDQSDPVKMFIDAKNNILLILDKEFKTNTDLRIDLFETSNNSVICAHIFRKNDLIYHCATCTTDETCVLCSDCWNIEAHSKHNYQYYLSRGNGGCCDCGEDESWKCDIQCPYHKRNDMEVFNVAKVAENTLMGTRVFAETLFAFLNEMILHYKSALNTPYSNEDLVLLLFNDEIHSFADVIEVLMHSLRIDEKNAEKVAETVDDVGFCVVYAGKLDLCKKISSLINSIELTTKVMNLDAFKIIVLIHSLMEWLHLNLRTLLVVLGDSVYFQY